MIIIFINSSSSFSSSSSFFFLLVQELALVSDRHFLLDEALLGPYPETLDYAPYYLAWQNKVIMYAALVFYGLSFIELMLHYLDQVIVAFFFVFWFCVYPFSFLSFFFH